MVNHLIYTAITLIFQEHCFYKQTNQMLNITHDRIGLLSLIIDLIFSIFTCCCIVIVHHNYSRSWASGNGSDISPNTLAIVLFIYKVDL